MIKNLFQSFIPLLVGFILLSLFLIWGHNSIEEKSKQPLVIQVPKSTNTAERGTDEVIRVLRPLFLNEKSLSNQPTLKKKELLSKLSLYYANSTSFDLVEQNNLFANLLAQNAYTDAKKMASMLIKPLRQEKESTLITSTLHYNLGIMKLINDQYPLALSHLNQVIETQNGYLPDLAKALTLINLNRSPEGLALINQVLGKTPNKIHPYIYFKLGNLYARQKEYLLALIELNKALALDAKFYQVTLNKAIIYRKMNRFQEAERIYAELLTQYPGYFKGIYNYGILLEKMDRKSEAIKTFEKALSLNLYHQELRAKLAEILFSQQLYSKALRHYRWMMKESQNNWELVLMVAKTELKLGNYPEATKLMINAIEKKGGNYPQAWLELGDTYLILGKGKLTLEAYQTALRLEPNNKKVLGRLAKYFSRNKNSTREIYYYQEALKLDPNDGLYLRRLGIALLKQDQLTEAAKYLESSIKFVSNPYRSYKYLAKVQDKLKNYSEADRYYQLTLSLQPLDDLDWYRYGITLFKMKQYRKSIKAFKNAEKYSDQEDHHFMALIKKRLANAYTKNKKFTPAIKTFKEALELNNGYFSARLDYAKLLLSLKGRKKQGQQELKLALRIKPNSCSALKLAKKYAMNQYNQKWKDLCLKN